MDQLALMVRVAVLLQFRDFGHHTTVNIHVNFFVNCGISKLIARIPLGGRKNMIDRFHAIFIANTSVGKLDSGFPKVNLATGSRSSDQHFVARIKHYLPLIPGAYTDSVTVWRRAGFRSFAISLAGWRLEMRPKGLSGRWAVVASFEWKKPRWTAAG